MSESVEIISPAAELDPVGESVFMKVLGAHRLHARITDNITYCGRWSDSDPTYTDRGLFHLIDTGACRVEAPFLPQPVELRSGDLILFPRGHAHMLCDILKGAPPGTPPPADTVMLCGEFRFETGPRNPIVDSLPDHFVVREAEGGASFRGLARVLAAESARATFGSQTVTDKLADALFVMAVRSFIARSQGRRGLLAALFDPRLARALSAIHNEPGRPWTVAALAEVALQSRTAFAEHFSSVLGATPIDYLTQWRMTEAARLLRDPRQSVAAAAEMLGYQTEAAFRRAFKRAHGFGPGQVRREAARASATS